MAALGLYRDDHDLVASDLGLDHLWDVSRFCQDSRLGCNVTSHHIRISSFSSNVALVVFECQEGKRVAMYHQVEKYDHPRIEFCRPTSQIHKKMENNFSIADTNFSLIGASSGSTSMCRLCLQSWSGCLQPFPTFFSMTHIIFLWFFGGRGKSFCNFVSGVGILQRLGKFRFQRHLCSLKSPFTNGI